MKLLVLAIALQAHQAFAKKLPQAFTICSRNDPQLDECFSGATQKALSLMTEPIPELSLPGIDPMKFDKIEIPPSKSDNFKFKQTLTNLELRNLKATKVKKTRVNLGESEFNVLIYTNTPWLKLEGNYEIDGKILVLTIKGEGTFTVTFDDVKVVVNMTGTIHRKKGKPHLQIDDVTFKMDPNNLIFKFDNLFNGNEDLGRSLNSLLNENWRPIYAEIGSTYEEFVAAYLKNVVTQIFNKVSYDDLFPIK
ncbi:hypothetical protein FQR65_LT08015 [Abscondita terminalis]|nr:hypothetical protein FQR65_LT08015 [Abscondita terminalis]